MAEGTPRRRTEKSDEAFRTIREVSEILDVPQHVLRFWETKFPQVKPVRRAGGRRYYRPGDIRLLSRIRDLLYRDGFTIKGVQNLLREHGRARLVEEAVPPAATPVPADPPDLPPQPSGDGETGDRESGIRAVIDELEELRRLLEKSVSGRCYRGDAGL